jgi:hypothetical protein
MDPDTDVEGGYNALPEKEHASQGDVEPHQGGQPMGVHFGTTLEQEQGLGEQGLGVSKSKRVKKKNPKATPPVVRTWLRIDPSGESSVLQADK